MRVVLVMLMFVSTVNAELWMPSLFSDNMVFQRDKPVLVWGKADPGAEITVELAGRKKTGATAANGKWQVAMDPLQASSEPQTLTVSSSIGNQRSTIRNVLVGEVWLISGQSNMQRSLKTIEANKEIAEASNPLIRYFRQEVEIASEPKEDVQGGKWLVSSPETAKDFSAVGYFMARDLQKHLGLPVGLLFAAKGGAPARCFISREVLLSEPATRVYVENYDEGLKTYPERQKKFDEQMAAFSESVKVAKAAGKKPPEMSAGLKWGCMGPGHQFQPYGLYNGMVRPLAPFALRGFAWYQGETDGNPQDAVIYRTMLPALIQNWREDWNDESLPFLIVQISNHQQGTDDKEFIGRPKLREAQLLTSETVPNTAMVVTIDIGEKDNIHPQNKEPVGERLALAARKIAYGEDLVYSGPVFNGLEAKSGTLLLNFKHSGSGLELRHGAGGFEIAGADGKFVAAQAKVDGSQLRVSSPDVPDPRFVRYGWRGWTEVSLFNHEGLPASPFRNYSDEDAAQWNTLR